MPSILREAESSRPTVSTTPIKLNDKRVTIDPQVVTKDSLQQTEERPVRAAVVAVIASLAIAATMELIILRVIFPAFLGHDTTTNWAHLVAVKQWYELAATSVSIVGALLVAYVVSFCQSRRTTLWTLGASDLFHRFYLYRCLYVDLMPVEAHLRPLASIWLQQLFTTVTVVLFEWLLAGQIARWRANRK